MKDNDIQTYIGNIVLNAEDRRTFYANKMHEIIRRSDSEAANTILRITQERIIERCNDAGLTPDKAVIDPFYSMKECELRKEEYDVVVNIEETDTEVKIRTQVAPIIRRTGELTHFWVSEEHISKENGETKTIKVISTTGTLTNDIEKEPELRLDPNNGCELTKFAIREDGKIFFNYEIKDESGNEEPPNDYFHRQLHRFLESNQFHNEQFGDLFESLRTVTPELSTLPTYYRHFSGFLSSGEPLEINKFCFTDTKPSTHTNFVVTHDSTLAEVFRIEAKANEISELLLNDQTTRSLLKSIPDFEGPGGLTLQLSKQAE